MLNWNNKLCSEEEGRGGSCYVKTMPQVCECYIKKKCKVRFGCPMEIRRQTSDKRVGFAASHVIIIQRHVVRPTVFADVIYNVPEIR